METEDVKETTIHAQPHQLLRAWQSFRLGEAVFFFGLSPSNEQIGTGQIRYFDSDSQRILGFDGMVWHIPAEAVFCQDFEDCTAEVLDLMSASRAAQQIRPFSTEWSSTGPVEDHLP